MIRYQKTPNLIVTLTLDMEGRNANIINHEIAQAFMPVLKQLQIEKAKGLLKGVILTSAKKSFLAGGDLDYLYHEEDKATIYQYAERLKFFFRELETPGVPVVACINGSALGSGFELTLACHQRFATDNPQTRLGNPEVSLGMMPGGGAVVRMLWMLGIEKALPILTEGKLCNVHEAKTLGLIDAIAPDEDSMHEMATEWLLNHQGHSQPWDSGKKIAGFGSGHSESATKAIMAATAQIHKRTLGHYPAVNAILNCMAEATMVDFDTALRIESRYFASIVQSRVAHNMTKAFWYDLNAIRDGANRPKGYGRFKARTIGVAGAGMMGCGIAFAAALAGVKVYVKDVSKAVAEKAKEYAARKVGELTKHGEISEAEGLKIMHLIIPTEKSDDFEECDLVIEAVFENKETKARVTKEAELHIHKESFFASNTSTIPISELAQASQRPANFIGMHFFSPADKMKLVEVIIGEKTSQETLARALDFVHQIKKTPIVVNDSRGFYASKVFSAFLLEGVQMLSEGIVPATIENAAKLAGMPMGPLALADELSLTLPLEIERQAQLAEKEQHVAHPAFMVLNDMVHTHRRPGKSKNAGFYDYLPHDSKKLWAELGQHYPIQEVQPSLDDIMDRLMFVQCLETVRCLEKGILASVADANIGSIYGWGFAPFKGGTLQFINDYGLPEFVSRSQELAQKYGERFLPSEGLVNRKEPF